MNRKIPPLALTCIFVALMSVLSWFFPHYTLNIPNNIIVSVLLTIVAAFISGMGVASFRNEKTTMNPTKPGQASSLVIKGMYRFSRNPMYLGFLLFLIAWGIYLAHSLSLLLLPTIFFIYINKYQIPDEEKALHIKFGDNYTNYKNRVRKWL